MLFLQVSSWFLVGTSLATAAASLSPRDNASSSSSSYSAPTVTLRNGSYYGVHSALYNQDFFLGMPFAQPPLHDLRLRQPQSLNTTWADTRNATVYQPECIGYGSDQWVLGNHVSEDCLSVNVIRPSMSSSSSGADANATTELLPVAVFFNPGGWFEGGNLDPRYNMSFIVQQSVAMGKPFIAVSPNYRLSLWGFLYGQEVIDQGITNLGMLDQRLALHWIQENIAAFGGDPAKVTIWGESAGAGSVGAHLVAYGGRDDKLFRAAISESGFCSGLVQYPTVAQWQPIYDYVVQATNCTGGGDDDDVNDDYDTLACLRTVPTEALSAVFNSTFNGSNIGTASNFGPQIDGDFLQASGTTQLKRGQFVRVPYLLGTNFDEGASFATPGAVNTTADMVSYMVDFSPSLGEDNATGSIDTLLALYPDIPEVGIPATLHGRPSYASGYGAQWKRQAAYIGDLKMNAARRLAAQTWARNNVSAYTYHFNVLVHGSTAYEGAGHFREVAFVFDDTSGLGYNNSQSVNPFADEPGTFEELADIMSRMWVSFITELDPNHSGVTDVEWPPYTLENPQNIVFDVNVTDLAYAEPDIYRAEGINFMQENLDTLFHQ